MVDSLSLVTLPLITGALGTFLIEQLLRPQPRFLWQRGIASGLIHLGSWLLLFGLFTLVLQRPWFAVVFILSLQLVVVQSSNTKSRTLNEPFICHDFEYFWDAVKHPRLYVPFFGIGLAIAASSAGAAAIAAFLFWEPSLASQAGPGMFVAISLGLATAGGLLLISAWRKVPSPRLEPVHDIDQLGLFTSLWVYGVALFRASSSLPPTPFSAIQLPASPQSKQHDASKQPNVIMVQSESFMDPRTWCTDVDPQLLRHFDSTCQQALEHGQLQVPAWGANTVRTESAVLTGITPQAWGARQFNPYRSLARQSVASLASVFQQAGYRCICVHPYPASFYLRDKVMPGMGFEEFLDIKAFSESDKAGQYTGDAAVARKIGRLLKDEDNRPLFIFTITMENHGPLHLESPSRSTLEATLPDAKWPLPIHQQDLAVYLNHLRQADEMLNSIKHSLQASTRAGVLCWYGDHVPILPEAYEHYGAPDGTTPYVIWSTDRAETPSQAPTSLSSDTPESALQVLMAEELGIHLFKQVFERDIKKDVSKAIPGHQEQE